MFKPGPAANGAGGQDLQRARDAALRFLAFRARSIAEVRHRLSRTFTPPVVERVIEDLESWGYLDDLDFATQWRRHRERHNPRDANMLRQELERLGVPPEVSEEALEGFDREANAHRAARRMARRLAQRRTGREEFQRKLLSYLERRGFGYSLARNAAESAWLELAADPLHGQEDADGQEG